MFVVFIVFSKEERVVSTIKIGLVVLGNSDKRCVFHFRVHLGFLTEVNKS